MMSKHDWADRFSSDIDKLLTEVNPTDLETPSAEYVEMLEVARTLSTIDFSAQSHIRHTLRRRLLNQIDDSLTTTVELSGPLGQLKNFLKGGPGRSSQMPTGNRMRWLQMALTGAASLILLLVALFLLPPPTPLSDSLSAMLARLLPQQQPAGLLLQFTEQWHFSGEGGISAGPAVAGDKLYAGSNAGVLYALDTQTGAEIWRYQTGGRLEARPVYAEGLIYAAGSDGRLYAVAAETGRLIWQFKTGDDLVAAPTVAAGAVYASSDDGFLYALEAASGAEVWRFQTGGPVESSPTVSAGLVYVGSHDHHLYALDAATGHETWRFKSGDWITAAPLVVAVSGRARPLVVVGSHDQYLYALDAATGQEQWRFQAGDNIVAGAAATGDRLYVGSYDGYLYALDVATGQEQWRFQTDHALGAAPLLDNGVVYFGSGDGYLYALDARTGQELARFDGDSQIYGSPIVAEDMIYFVSGKGKLQAVQIDARPVDRLPGPTPLPGQLPPPAPVRFQFTPDAWYPTKNEQDAMIHFGGRIVDEAGQPVTGFSIEADDGQQRWLSRPSDSTGQWEIVVPAPESGSGWWWLTIGRDDCAATGTNFDPHCQAFVRLSESVKVKVSYPDEARINADWVCHKNCQTPAAK